MGNLMNLLRAIAAAAIFGVFSGCATSGTFPRRSPWDDLLLYPRGETVRVTVTNKESTRVHFCGKLYDYNPYQLVLKLGEFDEELYEETRDTVLWQKPIHIRSENDYILTIRKNDLLDIRPCSPTDSKPRYDKNSP